MVIEHALEAEDTALFRAALQGLGWSVATGTAGWSLAPGSRPAAAEVFCGNAGTMFRFLLATLATLPGRWTVDGVARLRERPAGPLVAALRALGAEIECLDREGHAPLRITGGSLRGGAATLDAGQSSQYLSALLMAGLRARQPLEIEVSALTSRPYVDLTLESIAAFGGQVERQGSRWRVPPATNLGCERLALDADWSAACYPAGAAALAGEISLCGLRRDSPQGDRRFLDLLRSMGAEVEWRGTEVRVRGARLRAIDADLSDLPDQVPTLAALAPFARGTTEIRHVAHLRVKESDRLRAMTEGLQALGVPARERPDGLSIPGVWAAGVPPANAVEIDPRGDHRVAMSFALLGLRRPGVLVAHPEVVAKSYPGFWADLDSWLEV